MRVLVVDDDALNREILRSLLGRREHEAVVVDSGDVALRSARTEPPDLLVTDIFMPGMDGFRLCMKWCKDPLLSSIPVVFYTGMFTSPADMAFALRLGACALLTKPMDPEALLDALEAAVCGKLRPDVSSLPEDGFDALSEYTDRLVERLEQQVAELNEANLALMRANELQSALIDCSPLGIALMDRSFQPRLWSPAAEQIFGWTATEVVGVFNPLVHGNHKAADALRTLTETGTAIQDMEVPRQRSDGSHFVMSISASRVLDADGKPDGVLALFSDVTQRKRAAAELEAAVKHLERAMEGSVQVISRIVEKRDPYTAGHEQRVAELAVAIGERMGLDADTLRELRTAAAVHDVGKICVPTEILSKPGKLTPLEWEMIRVHPLAAVEILQVVEFGWPLAEIVGQHHERMDGSGYPNGLVGDEILLEARILAVADVVEAMSSHRPYRPARGVDLALAEVRANRGRLYDAVVVDACVAVVEQGAVAL